MRPDEKVTLAAILAFVIIMIVCFIGMALDHNRTPEQICAGQGSWNQTEFCKNYKVIK